MGDNSAIEWTDSTWNPIVGCTRVSEGCRNCYAERFVHRFAGPGQRWDGLTKSTPSGPRWTGEARLMPGRLDVPLRWKTPRRIFVNSMSDLFHESLSNEAIAAVFGVMAAAHWHTYQILTKRADRMLEWFKWHAGQTEQDGEPHISVIREAMGYLTQEQADSIYEDERAGLKRHWPLRNVWLGVSVENQAAADERIPLLLQTPAAKRFLSCEPLLGEVDLYDLDVLAPECWGDCACDSLFGYDPGCRRNGGDGQLHRRIDWVIAGGESGPGARPMQATWARSLRDQCADAKVPFFFKQWGEWVPDTSSVVRTVGGADHVIDHGEMVRLGKRAAGAELDGREHKEFPR